jgi:hypothetical protein
MPNPRRYSARQANNEMWPVYLVRLRLAGAPQGTIDYYARFVRIKARWSQHKNILNAIDHYEPLNHSKEL